MTERIAIVYVRRSTTLHPVTNIQYPVSSHFRLKVPSLTSSSDAFQRGKYIISFGMGSNESIEQCLYMPTLAVVKFKK